MQSVKEKRKVNMKYLQKAIIESGNDAKLRELIVIHFFVVGQIIVYNTKSKDSNNIAL